ncbi:MAG TPA: NAD(P)-dependent oxidoreductase [Stellaceae bacterium]|nr:NAD(P)-dependent oxidoreductase [Stellaceae bacterium]
MATILVTGGCGFIGAAVCRRLAERGDTAVAFDIRSSPAFEALRARYPTIVFAPGELTEWPQVMDVVRRYRPDGIVHCAAIVGVVQSLSSPIATLRVNVEGSLNVMTAMRLHGIRRMVNLSTEEIYGPFSADTIDETHPCRPMKPYGISKFAVEQLGRDMASEHGLSILHLRTCWVYGPGLPRPRVPKTLVDAAVDGRSLHIERGGDFRVDHVFIDDLVDGIVLALDAPTTTFDAYHLATGTARSLGEIVAILRDLVPGADISIGPGNYSFADGVEVVRKGALDITRARTDLGYAPRYDIRAGLAACIAARREELQ